MNRSRDAFWNHWAHRSIRPKLRNAHATGIVWVRPPVCRAGPQCQPAHGVHGSAAGRLDASGAAPGFVARLAPGWDFRHASAAGMFITFPYGADGAGCRASSGPSRAGGGVPGGLPMHDLTRILAAVERGDRKAADQLRTDAPACRRPGAVANSARHESVPQAGSPRRRPDVSRRSVGTRRSRPGTGKAAWRRNVGPSQGPALQRRGVSA